MEYIIKNKKEPTAKYPKLMIFKEDQNRIALFLSSDRGIYIKHENPACIGEYSLKSDFFSDFHGTLTLENTYD